MADLGQHLTFCICSGRFGKYDDAKTPKFDKFMDKVAAAVEKYCCRLIICGDFRPPPPANTAAYDSKLVQSINRYLPTTKIYAEGTWGTHMLFTGPLREVESTRENDDVQYCFRNFDTRNNFSDTWVPIHTVEVREPKHPVKHCVKQWVEIWGDRRNDRNRTTGESKKQKDTKKTQQKTRKECRQPKEGVDSVRGKEMQLQ